MTLPEITTTLEVRKMLFTKATAKRKEFKAFHDKAHAVFTNIQKLKFMRESAALATNHSVKVYKGDVKLLQDNLIAFSQTLLSGIFVFSEFCSYTNMIRSDSTIL